MRAQARWGALPLLAAPVGAWALGLGEIELQSAFNQPLDASIALVSATSEELSTLEAKLAARESFERRGLDRPEFLSELQFRLAKDASGRDVIRVTSRRPITELFVTMLVEVTWSSGRSQREYTVLLDQPVLLPREAVAAPVQPPATRVPAGRVERPAEAGQPPRSAAQPPRVAPPASAPRPSPPAGAGGTYGPVQRAETLWSIAAGVRPEGVTMNQMMLALYEANPQAFGGNMNRLLRGAMLEIPEAGALELTSPGAATAEVRRQTAEWRGESEQSARLRLEPPTDAAERVNAPAPATPRGGAAGADQLRGEVDTLRSELEENRRLLEVRDEELRALQEQLRTLQQQVAAGRAPTEAAPPPAAATPAPDGPLESEQLFADEGASEAAGGEPEPETGIAVAPADSTRTVTTKETPSLWSRALDWITSPVFLIGLGVLALLAAAVGFIGRRRGEPEEVTGRWEALEAQVDEEEREATDRMRSLARPSEEGFLVEEQLARPARAEEGLDEATPSVDLDLDGDAQEGFAHEEPADMVAATDETGELRAVVNEDTLSSQTVINLDEADPVAEADFHMAYGLYDQAAELVSKALEADPERRDLKLKLLEVYFVWGNKASFLEAAQSLRAEMGERPDSDWDKVVIMGKQICPGEALFAQATAAAGRVDVDLGVGDSPTLDLALEETGPSAALDFQLEATGENRRADADESQTDSLDIGAQTAAGLQAALVERSDADAESDVTQESPTIESPAALPSTDSPTAELAALADAPTVETPALETSEADAPTMETPMVADEESRGADRGGDDRTVEIDLDDLGLEVEELDDLDDDLSSTGVTHVLGDDERNAVLERGETIILGDDDSTLLAPSMDDDEPTAVPKSAGDDTDQSSSDLDDLEMSLDELSAALQGSDTVEQPGLSAPASPVDLELESDTDSTDAVEVSPLDPQTMTEVGTKLDLARAYIDMGDPEGARSILEEVLDEGDPSQRREAQDLIDSLSA